MLHNNQDTTPPQEGTPTESEKITDTQEISSAVSDMLEDDFEGSHSNQKIIRDLAAQKEALIKEINEYSEKIEKLKAQYEEGYNIYQNLLKEANLYKETIDLAGYGVYEPHFSFDTSEQYKDEINFVREKQKYEIRNGTAVLGGNNITWNGSLVQGAALVKREKKIMLRTFNGECDGFIASVDWNNILKMEERLKKSFFSINKLYEKQGIVISRVYYGLKLKELRLTYEYKNKKHEEKEEQRAIREQMREKNKYL